MKKFASPYDLTFKKELQHENNDFSYQEEVSYLNDNLM